MIEVAVSGYIPIRPVSTVWPVLVIAEAASTAYCAAVPRLTCALTVVMSATAKVKSCKKCMIGLKDELFEGSVGSGFAG